MFRFPWFTKRKNSSKEKAFVDAVDQAVQSSMVAALKELYAGYFGPPYYAVEGAREELIKRIKALPQVEKVILGVEDET
jgi:hypothetical protein